MSETSGFQLLWADEPAGLARWTDLWDLWPEREVYAHPYYASLFCAEGDRAVCVAWSGDRGGVLFPLIMRPLAKEPWAGAASGCFDFTSPYGYGGAFFWGQADAQDFWGSFNGWASGAGATCCFARLFLFPDQLLPFSGTMEGNAPNVVRTLDLPPEALWMEYEHKVRKNVKRAQREGVRVELDREGSHIKEFLSIYHGTMDRRGAAASYYFDRTFFDRLVKGLPGQFVFFHALHGDTIISTELVLISADTIYSFLGGTKEEAFDLRPNDLLKHEIILWGQREGKRAFVLGGGYGGPDGIFRYKHSFAPNGVVPFRTGHIIFDQQTYDQLVATRRSWEAAQGNEWQPRPGFFPAYRG